MITTPPVAPSRKVAQIDADKAGDRSHGDRDRDQPREPVGEQIGGGPGGHHQRNHQKRAHGLHRRHGGGGEQREKDHLERCGANPDGARMALIEEHQHQVLPDHRQHHERDRADNHQLVVSAGVIASTLPSTMVCTLIGVGEIETMNSPSAKKEMKDHADHRILAQPVRARINSIAAAASPPARNAPAAKGRPSM
jgi:hypothetical protein